MNRYYLLMDYTVPVFTDYGNGNVSMTGPLQGSAEDKREFYREHPHTPCPKTRCILDFEPGIRLYVAYHDVDVGQFVIRSRSRKMAYELATLLRALFSLFYGWQLDDRTGHYFLQEMKRLPQPSWDEQRMLAELQELNQIRKNNIDTILSKKSDLGIAPDTEYTRYHEIFSGHTKRVRYRELICHFLDLRNIVAAHGNRNPPERAKLIEDNVFEIQLFLMELLSKAIYSNETNTTS
jgi:hypothetical protein